MSFEPLKGVRVLDLTSVVVGPVCTWRLGQYGAEIVKLESPEGDLMRGLGGLSPTGQHSGAYLHFNRGKRNICLDLKKPARTGGDGPAGRVRPTSSLPTCVRRRSSDLGSTRRRSARGIPTRSTA